MTTSCACPDQPIVRESFTIQGDSEIITLKRNKILDINYDMSEVIIQLDQELSGLLKMPMIHATGNFDHPIGHRLLNLLVANQATITFYKQGMEDDARRTNTNRQMAYFRLASLLDHLQIINKYDRVILDAFRALLCSANEDTYYGCRLEVAMAALFIDWKITFEKRESPDFKIPVNGENIYIECTSSHFKNTTPSNKNLEHKIGSTIRSKIKKKYANCDTALFIDITNVHSRSSDTNNLLRSPNHLGNYIATIPNYSKYGSIIALTYQFNRVSQKYAWAIAVRKDTPSCSPALTSFLELHFEQDMTAIYDSIVPNTV